jgi:hypothetical protein
MRKVKENVEMSDKKSNAKGVSPRLIKQAMSLLCLCRILGLLWLCSLFTFLFLGTTTYAGGMPLLDFAVYVLAIIAWIVSSIVLVAIFVRSVWRSRSKAPDESRPAMARWLSSVASGLLGGVAAVQVNYIFPGERTLHSYWLSILLLFSLIGMLVGAIPLVFPLKPRMTAILAFVLSAAFSWWLIANVFR